MSALQLYTRATSALLTVQGSILLLSPSIGTWLLSAYPHTATPLEAILARLLAVALLLLAFLILLFSGEISVLYEGEAAIESPYAVPTLYATVLYNAIVAILLYTASYTPALSSTVVSFCSVVALLVAFTGLLLLIFGQGPGHISRRTGADKRTSGFPFRNVEADKKRR